MTEDNGSTKRRIAAIDLGTNSFHALIVDIFPDGSFAIVDALKEMVTLGRDGLGQKLPPDAFKRGLAALRKIKTLCDSYRVEKILAYATSAIREAENGGEFIQRVIDEIHIKILAIPGKTEAELIGHAVQHALALGDKPVLITDIGGGSTEFIIATDTDFLYLDSRKIGVSRMSASLVKSDPISQKDLKELTSVYKTETLELSAQIRHFKPEILVGTSGTMQNIATMIAAHNKLNTSITLNEFEYSAADFFSFYDKFIKLNSKQRLQVPGLDSKRVDFVVAGLVLVNYLLKKFDIKRIKTCTQAMREGIILRYIKREMGGLHMLAKYPQTRKRSIYELLYKCNWHEDHSQQVTKLALKIFDDLREHHKLSDIDRELLEYAALTHDIGYHISHQKHHKHALYLILNADLKGFTQEEIEIIANVARYHRRSAPKSSHKFYDVLTSEQKKRIRALAGILRVADGLDRSHFQNVKSLTASISDKVYIDIKTMIDPQLEVWGAMRKRELLEKLFGKPIKIRAS